jgi:insulysin
MGSARFPQQDVLFAFLAQHGGRGNAYTASETTNYFFEVDPPFLQHATSIMADSVISPLLSTDAAAAEINAVNAEHAKNHARDGWRIDMLGRSFALPHHELSRFSTGNEETLRSSLPALREFHSKFYTAAHAAAAVAGPLSLDDLEAVAVTAFGHMRRQTVAASADDSGDGESPTTSAGAPRRLQPYLLAGPAHSPGLQARSTCGGIHVVKPYNQHCRMARFGDCRCGFIRTV